MFNPERMQVKNRRKVPHYPGASLGQEQILLRSLACAAPAMHQQKKTALKNTQVGKLP